MKSENRIPRSELRVLNDCRELYVMISNYINKCHFRILPKELKSQIIRSTISIGSNIAEGNGRESEKDFIRFLNMGKSSLNELEFQMSLINKNGKTEIYDKMDKIKAIIYKIKIRKSEI